MYRRNIYLISNNIVHNTQQDPLPQPRGNMKAPTCPEILATGRPRTSQAVSKAEGKASEARKSAEATN